jgi:hypothetical protein
MEWNGLNASWRINGPLVQEGATLFDGWQIDFPNGMTDAIQTNILLKQHPTLRIHLQRRDLENDYENIGVVQSTNGLSSFGIYMAKNKPPHQPEICVDLMTPATAAAITEDNGGFAFRHALLNQIVHRVAVCIFSAIEGSDFGAFGVYSSGTYDPNEPFRINSGFDWQGIKQNAIEYDSKPFWQGIVNCPRPTSVGPFTSTEKPRTVDKRIYANLYDTAHSDYHGADADTQVYVEEEDITPVIHTIKPMWKEHTAIVYYNRNQSNQFWIEETRCKTCGQRIIVHLSKAQCPEGTPDTTIRCSACKNDFQFH